MTERIDIKNEKETRKRDEAEAKSLRIKAGLTQEVIEKEVIREIPIKEIIEKPIEVIKEVDNPKHLEKIKQLEASLRDDNKVIADLNKKLEESKRTIAKFENLKKLLDSAQ